MLRFILGTGGSGKTACLHNQINNLVNSGESEVLMLVPDQSSFETEKFFLDSLGAKLCKKVTVFGFDGMCRHVFKITRNVPQNVIDNGTRAVLMSIALEQLSEKLELLGGKKKRGVGELMLSTLSECKKNGVTTEMLREVSKKVEDETLSKKLSETALVLDTYDALLSQSYIDPYDNLERLKNILLENNDLFKNQVLFIDAFSGFTKVQFEILRLLMNRCREVNIALTLDPMTDGTEEVFAVSQQTYEDLKRMAKLDGIEIKAPVKLTSQKRFENAELAVLERGLFRRDRGAYEKEPEKITIYAAADIYDECEFAARRIRELVIDRGMRYSDISVICRDADLYRGVLNVILEKYDIPYFTDVHRDVETMPVIRFVNAVFRLILDGFRREDMLSLLKTGLTLADEREISAFENYVYVWNLSGKPFTVPFDKNPRGFAEKMTSRDEKNLERAENARQMIMKPLLTFKDEVKDKTGRGITELLYGLLTDFKVPEALSEMYDLLESGGEKGLGAEQIRVWSLLMDALDKMAAITGDMPLSAERYFELLSIQISNIEFSQIPRTIDSVTVTTAQRVRNSSQKAAFLLGCVEGEFPAVPSASGLFSAYEIKQLLVNEITISDDFAYTAGLETFMAYSALISPESVLFASCPMVNLEGAKQNPSVIFEEIIKIFPKLPLSDKTDYDSRIDSMYALTPAFEEYARSLSGNRGELMGLREFFENNPRYSHGAKAVQRALDNTPFKLENADNARLLFGENLTVSASQVEKFSLCKFSYFCNYGLNIRERRKAEIDPMEYGTLVHYILERFFGKYSKNEYSAMTESAISEFIRLVLTEYLEGYLGGSETKEKSFLYRLEVLSRNLLLMVSHIIKELCQSDFEVADCELKIGKDIPSYTLSLPTGQNIAVCGSIDRVDIMELNGEKYIRIIDYKTGAKSFKLSDILFGLNLQMLLYLCAIGENGVERYGESKPAGILYMPAVVPNINADGMDGGEIEEEIDSTFKMNGLLLNDVRIIKGMDKTENAKYIPVKIKNGSAEGKNSLATLEQFGKIFKRLNKTVTRMGEKLYGGEIEAVPLKGGTDSCEYCPYDSVCGYRRAEPVTVYSTDNAEVFEKLDREEENHEQSMD